MRRSILILTAVVLAVFAPSASAVTPKKAPKWPKYHKFVVKMTGSQNTTWSMPLEERKRDCYHVDFHEAKGEETWEIFTRGQQKAMLVEAQDGYTQLVLGTWDIEEPKIPALIDLGSKNIRSRTERAWTTGGPCGGEREDKQFPKGDCGTRIPSYTALFEVGREFRFNFGANGDPNAGFDRCTMVYPQGIHDNVWKLVPVKMNEDRLTNPRAKKTTVSYKKNFKYKPKPGERPTKSETKVKWEWTFIRVR